MEKREKPDFAPNYIGEIMSGYWKWDPNERLAFRQIEEKISSQMESADSLSPMTIWIWKCHTRRSTKRKLTFLQLNRLAKRLDSKEEVAKRNSLPSRINSSTTQMKTKLSKKLSLKETPESVECEPLPRNVNKPENFFSRLGRRFSLYYEFRGEHIIKK